MRRGDWIQIFLMFFFFLLLFVALALLFIERDTLQTTRPELGEDLAAVKAQATLAGLLHTPVELDVNGGGNDPATLAMLLVMNRDRERDADVESAIKSALAGSPYHYQFFIYYEGGISSGIGEKLAEELSDEFGGERYQEVRNAPILSGPHASRNAYRNLGVVDMELPDGITIRFILADQTTRVNGRLPRWADG